MECAVCQRCELTALVGTAAAHTAGGVGGLETDSHREHRRLTIGTEYYNLSAFSGGTASEPTNASPWGAAGVLRHFIIQVSDAPGTGKSWTFTVMKNGVATSMSSPSRTTTRVPCIRQTCPLSPPTR